MHRLLPATALAALVLVPLPALPATAAPADELIAFVSERTGNDELYVIAPDGTGLRQLTDSPGFDRAPSWSPDGRTIVFNSRRAPHTDRPQIYGLDVATGAATRLTDDPLEEQRASVRGDTVFFHRGRFGSVPYDVWSREITSGTETRLTTSIDPNIWNAAPAVSPDGTRVLFQSNRDVPNPRGPFPQSLYVLELATGAIARVPHPAGLDPEVSLDGPRWNPDGTRIVVAASTDDGSIIHVADAVGAPGTWHLTPMTEAVEDASAPAWSPDGRSLVYQATDPDDDERTIVRIRDLTTGATVDLGEGRTPVWAAVAPAPPAPAKPTLAATGTDAAAAPIAVLALAVGALLIASRARRRSRTR